jgi:hypothetical protein
VQSYAYEKIPLETFVTDSQYMNHDQDFTFSTDYTASEMQARLTALPRLLVCGLPPREVMATCSPASDSVVDAPRDESSRGFHLPPAGSHQCLSYRCHIPALF